MEFGSTSRRFFPTGLSKRSRQNRQPPSGRKMKTLKLVESSSSDNEDDVVKPTPPRSLQTKNGSTGIRMHRIFEELEREKEKSDNEEEENELLKGLGLYEEGMTKEQKQEILMVIEASKVSAKHEASIRETDEWESEIVVLNDRQDTVIPANGILSLIPSQEKEKIADFVTVDDSDEETRLSSEMFPFTTKDDDQVSTLETVHCQNSSESLPATQIASDSDHESPVRPRRFLSRLSRKRLVQLEQKAPTIDAIKNIWTAQNAAVVELKLLRNTSGQLVDKVPYYCPSGKNPATHAKLILNDINSYNTRLRLAQHRMSSLIPWNSPIILGRSRLLTRFTASERKPSRKDTQSFDDVSDWTLELGGSPAVIEKSETPVHIPDVFETKELNQTEDDIFPSRSPCPRREKTLDREENPSHDQITSRDREKTALRSNPVKLCAFEEDFQKDGSRGKGSESPDDGDFEVRPKPIRKRNQNPEGTESMVSRKKSKLVIRDRYSLTKR